MLSTRTVAFTTQVAARLPDWRALTLYHRLIPHLAANADEVLWDDAALLQALTRHPVTDVALLAGSVAGDEIQLLVAPDPSRRQGYLVGAMLNWAIPYPDPTSDPWSHVPRAIAVREDPARAAGAVTSRLLPRIQQCVWSVRMAAVTQATHAIRAAVADWDAVSDGYCDPQGQRYDAAAYGLGLVARDAQAWRGFDGFLIHGPEVLSRLEDALLAASPGAAPEVGQRLTALRQALAEGDRLRWQWAQDKAAAVTAGASPEALADLEAERNEEARHSMTVVSNLGLGLGELEALLPAPLSPGGSPRRGSLHRAHTTARPAVEPARVPRTARRR